MGALDGAEQALPPNRLEKKKRPSLVLERSVPWILSVRSHRRRAGHHQAPVKNGNGQARGCMPSVGPLDFGASALTICPKQAQQQGMGDNTTLLLELIIQGARQCPMGVFTFTSNY